jgi:hypothetical protein
MDRQESQTTSSARPCLKRKLDPEFQGQDQARKILAVQDPNRDGTVFAALTNQIYIFWIEIIFCLSGYNGNLIE